MFYNDFNHMNSFLIMIACVHFKSGVGNGGGLEGGACFCLSTGITFVFFIHLEIYIYL